MASQAFSDATKLKFTTKVKLNPDDEKTSPTYNKEFWTGLDLLARDAEAQYKKAVEEKKKADEAAAAKAAKQRKAYALKEEADEMMEDGDYDDAAKTYAI